MKDYSEYECNKCNGDGKYYQCDKNNRAFLVRCSKCDGEGSLDWIENVIGKRPKLYTDSSSAINIDSTASQIAVLYPRGHGKTAFLEAQKQIDKEIIQVMSNKIAMKIDKEIMDALGGKENE